MDYKYYKTIDSTNNEAKRLIALGEIKGKTCLVAEEQTAGRGRQGKSFFSPDTGLYMTVLFPVDCPITSQVTMTVRTACAVAEAIEELKICDNKIGIKWVNDIYISDRKCSGILCEAINDYDSGRMKYIIIGIGINIYAKDWPKELKGKAGSLFVNEDELMRFVMENKLIKDPSSNTNIDSNAVSGSDQNVAYDLVRTMFAQRIADKLTLWLFEKQKDDFLNYYRSHSIVLGKKIQYIENYETKEGTAVDIDENGGLVLEDDTVLSSGEISILIE